MNYKKEDLPKLVGREFRGVDGEIVTIDYVSPVFVLSEGNGTSNCHYYHSFADEYPELLPEIPEGFTRWFGGDCPVDGNTVVETYRLGSVIENRAKFFNWDGQTAYPPIQAYRIIEEAPEKEAKTIDIGEWWEILRINGDSSQMWVSDGVHKKKEDAIKRVMGFPLHDRVGIRKVNSTIVELV